MRLEKIKLSGFKSFVDTTTIPFASDLVGIVGPNGCGKSNVIDAVRWVLGESSAKHLRGDQMADVIFNGSTTRKPVGQAFVELFFDNSDGTITGEFAAYREISLKRQVNREGQSVYFLNGTRCRRKDITDLFLGTGLGPRSYAIIEQGTISRIVEAKPDELRVFLEEAAGISKYKERRRDTENRIRRTRENLERIADICEEIEKQCRHLKRQAGTAERYKELKTQERQLKAQLLALRWQALNEHDERQHQKLQTLQLKIDEALAMQREVEKNTTLQREKYNAQRETLNEVQATFYAVGSDIAKSEQALQQQQAKKEQFHAELERYKTMLSLSKQELADGKGKSAELDDLIAESEQALLEAKQQESLLAQSLIEAEFSLGEWQKKWDDFTYRVAEPKRAIDVEKIKIDQLEKQLFKSTQGLATVNEERARLQKILHDNGSVALQEQHDALEAQQQKEQALLVTNQQAASVTQQFIYTEGELLSELRSEYARLAGRLESIVVLLRSNLADADQNASQWLADMGLTNAATLVEKIDVVAGWEKPLEIVLGKRLQAICVDDMTAILNQADGWPSGGLTLFNSGLDNANNQLSKTSLASLVTADMPAMVLLKHVHVAESIAEARTLISTLAEHESVITRDGVWLHADSVCFKPDDNNDSVLLLEKEKNKLAQHLEALSKTISLKEQALTSARIELSETEKKIRDLSQKNAEVVKQLSRLNMQLNEGRTKAQQAQHRLEQIDADSVQAKQEFEQATASLSECKLALERAIDQSAQLETQRGTLQAQRDEKKSLLDDARRQVHAARELTHGLMLKLESIRSSQALAVQNTQMVKGRITLASEKVSEFTDQLQLIHDPLDEEKKLLEENLKKRLLIEDQLAQVRSAAETTEQMIRELEAKRHQSEQQVLQARENASAAKVDHQEVLVRKQTLVEQLQETGIALSDTLANIPDEASESAWQEQVSKLAEKIDRLGPINLTAIEEYETQSERKKYLDSQQNDLTEALKTLETAIEKIDKESRFLFKQTFDKVNAGFERRFPKLFGGGHAYLQQTGEDLLDAGVTVMARPPGKRNSSIHLLSGGEKALTAVALVFSIFDLNPSPFCMLDEVDAPLDEANVGRFGALVKEMSENVQMILITHNKATMEITNQLAGVTMKEPGVSRLVAVDIEEAVKMVAS
jgi:chromosome segregation protein